MPDMARNHSENVPQTLIWAATIAVCVPLLARCASSQSGAESPPPPEPAKAEEPKTLSEQMEDHFEVSLDVRLAVINGDLPMAKLQAKELATSIVEQKMESTWRDYAETLRAAAVDFDNSVDLSEASFKIASMATKCADCHTGVAGPKFTVPGTPEEGHGVINHMQWHAWAADRLWEGLFVPSDELWNAGAKALSGQALHLAEIEKDKALDETAQLSAERAHELSDLALKAGTSTERATILGELLSTCAGCHTMARPAPESTPAHAPTPK